MNIDSFSALDQDLSHGLAIFQPFYLAYQQVYTLAFGALQELFSQEKFSNRQVEALSKDEVIKLLPTSHKIAVLLRFSSTHPALQHFLFRTCSKLCPTHFANEEAFVREFNQFREEVGALTEGMITVNALTPLRVFRMRLFAAIERTYKHIQGEKKYVFGVIGSFDKEFRNCKKDLLIAFDLFDADKVDYSREGVEKALRCAIVLFDSIWKVIKDKPDRPALLEDVKWVNQLLRLLQKGAAHPTSFLPILLLPLQNVKFVCDPFELNPKVERWLNDFSYTLQIHMEMLSTLFSRATKQNKTTLKDVCEKLSGQTFGCTKELNTLVNAFSGYETLHAIDQRKQVGVLAAIVQNLEKASQSLQALRYTYSQLMHYVDRLCGVTPPDQAVNPCAQYPYSCYLNLAYAVLETLKKGAANLMTFHETIEEVLPQGFRSFHATLIDLIDLRLRQEDPPHQLLISVLHEMRQVYAPSRYSKVQGYAESRQNAILVESMKSVATSENPLHKKVFLLLKNGLKTRSWPKLFLRSPFADADSQKLENGYYYAWSQILYNRVDALPNLGSLVDRCRQAALKAKQEPIEKYKPAARLFWEEVSRLSLKIDEWEEKLTCLDSENPLKEQIQKFQKQLKIDILSPGQAIKAFLDIEDGQVIKKSSRVVRKNRGLLRPTVDWSPRVLFEPKKIALKEEQQTFAQFEQTVRLLGDRCLGFTAATQHQVRLTALQQSSGTHLLNSLPAIKELVTHLASCAHLPFFIHALYLKMSVALEQALIFTTAHLNIYKDPEDKEHALLKTRGQECFWQTHDLLYFKALLQNHVYTETKNILFTKESRQLFEKLSRVVGVSGRHPASGHDELSDLLMGVSKPELVEERWNQAQGTLSSIFKTMKLKGEAPKEEPLSDVECLINDDPLPKWREDARELLQSFQDQVRGLQEYLSFPHNRLVPLIDEYDETGRQRQGTIMSSLNDIAIYLNILDSLIFFPEDPSLCLTLTEEALLSQASILESVFLIVLSYLPERYLWEETKPRPRRYSHQIDEFAKRLRGCGKREDTFYQKTGEISGQLVHYLKHSFRYYQPSSCPATQLRDQIKILSIMRERGANIDDYIARVLVLRIKLPTLEVLKIAKEWLTIYEELLE